MGEKLLTLFMVLFLALPLYAQMEKADSFTIKGQVLDSLTNASVPYATLRIALASTPEKPIKLLACDIDGKFQTPLNNIGTYIIVMQSIGKAPAEKVFTLSDERKVMDLGVLFMQDNNLRLEEVTVTAQKPLVKAEIDRIIYCLEDDPEAQTNNTLEMLRKVPMVTVDGEDKIELKGSSNFKVYMNGKPSNLLSNNPSVVLKSMPASSVKNIEVITEPGVKYDAEGIGGIINIIMVKNTLQGYTGSVSLNTITNGRIFGSGYLSLKAGKFGLSANYNCDRDNTPWNDASSMREDLNNKEEHYLNQVGRSKSRAPYHFGNLEGSYEIDSLNLLTVGIGLYLGTTRSVLEYAVKMLDADRNPVYSYNRNSESSRKSGSADMNVDYQRSTRKKDELLTLSYRFSRSPNDNEDYTELTDIRNYEPWLGYPQNNINKASTNEHTGQFDYTTPTWKDQSLEAGIKYIYRQSRSNTDRKAFNQTSQMWEEATPADSHFDHSQQIYSAYLGYTMKFGKFGVKAGARAEGTSLKVRYELAPDMNFGNDYFDVVPSAVVSYQLSMSQQLRLGYNMRIQRPGIWYLNPYVSNADPQNISYGNSNLDSEKSNGVNLNYSIFAQKFSFNTSISYTFIDNSIERYTFIDPADPGIFRTTYGNIGKRQTTGLFVYGSWNPIPLFRVNLNGSLSYTDLRSEKNDMANSGFSGRVFAGAQFNLPLDIRLNLNGGFISSAIQLQGRRSPLNFATVYVSRDFLKKKLSVSLYFYDMFWKRRKMEATIYDDTFHRQDICYSPTRTFGIGISYRFGNLKDAIKKVKRGIRNDDVKALESGS